MRDTDDYPITYYDTVAGLWLEVRYIKDYGTPVSKRYYWQGKLHRQDGPAMEWADGDYVWFLNDERHREDGPALNFSASSSRDYYRWYLHNEEVPCKTQENFEQLMRLRAFW